MRPSMVVLALVALCLAPLVSAQNSAPALAKQTPKSADSAGEPQSASTTPQRSATTPEPPEMLWECDQNNCAQLQGIWVFQGSHGQAMWNVGSEPATLTIKQFDGTHIVIDRVDPPDAVASRNLAGNGASLRVEYTGTISGSHIDGTAVWDKVPGKPYPWSATIVKEVCKNGTSCPLTADQRMQLGLNLFNSHLHVAALDVFAVDEDTNPDVKGFAAFSLAKGSGPASSARDDHAFQLANESAAAGSGVGMVVLGRFYEDGVGTPVNAALGAQWLERGQAVLDVREAQAQQPQTLLQWLGQALLAASMDGGGGSSDSDTTRNMQQKAAQRAWEQTNQAHPHN